jgi:hypothetical protein
MQTPTVSHDAVDSTDALWVFIVFLIKNCHKILITKLLLAPSPEAMAPVADTF